ncbi:MULTISPECIES: Ycf66 family protein [Cyanophyceae]|uniref:Ycf66 family protein n=1 Tax=Cyanophyceae TaxID=3028117 RepID=UPI001685F3AA|nr:MULTISPECIES: Ycf66 family protein [Cyanophyceae]MBD1918381.1 hypothetical protein [Phormidium sp. FACHB-77]MBD2028750.1 hypothetical protein [Phormidium sp. FACHB-322]MBD2051171.1 hypothetical protein [Leptolyngbya sp. FACHB-60]
MGVHVLAIAVWLGSISLYGAAFFFPEVHRRHDFFWSGVGAFYGLVLWFSAVQTSPAELLGHLASVVLLGWLGWQTLNLRRKRTPLDLQTPITQDSWPTFGRQLKQWTVDLLRGTPLERWLPQADDGRLPGDPAIATSEIRASSLKDVDYEFVDELAPGPRRPSFPGAIFSETVSHIPEPVVLEPAKSSASPPVKATRSPQPRTPQAVPASKNPQNSPKTPPKASQVKTKQKPPTVGVRLAGLKAWVGDIVKAKTSPKPKRAVIEIPPRPSPLAKTKRPPAASPNPITPESGVDPSSMVTIVDTEATESFDGFEGDDPRRDTRSESVPGSGKPRVLSEPDAVKETSSYPQAREVASIPEAEEEENWPSDPEVDPPNAEHRD